MNLRVRDVPKEPLPRATLVVPDTMTGRIHKVGDYTTAIWWLGDRIDVSMTKCGYTITPNWWLLLHPQAQVKNWTYIHEALYCRHCFPENPQLPRPPVVSHQATLPFLPPRPDR